MPKKKKLILGQDKNYSGKIPTKELTKAINKLKKRYQEHYDSRTEIAVFEINGGKDITKTGKEVMEDFDKWAIERNMRAIYNNRQEMEIIRKNLRKQEEFKRNQENKS